MNAKTLKSDSFACIGRPRRIWAIAAIHAEASQLMDIHDELYSHIRPGDRLLYMGNYTGYNPKAVETINELLTFRRTVMAIPGMAASDIIYLRGQQEDMWMKLLEIPFTPSPRDVLHWMLDCGLAGTLESYGMNPVSGLQAAREGTLSLTRWINRLRQAQRAHPGHEIFTSQWKRAAITQSDDSAQPPLLFVHAGLDPCCELDQQGDNFWQEDRKFEAISEPYAPFGRIVRGYDPEHKGVYINGITATIDAGCGFGGSLACSGFASDGEFLGLYESGM